MAFQVISVTAKGALGAWRFSMQIRGARDKGCAFTGPAIGPGASGGAGTRSVPGEGEKGLHSLRSWRLPGREGLRALKGFLFTQPPGRRPSVPLPCPHAPGLCDFGPQLRPGKREHRGFQGIHLWPLCPRPAAQSQEPIPAARAATAHDRAECVKPLRSVQTSSVTSWVQLSARALGQKKWEELEMPRVARIKNPCLDSYLCMSACALARGSIYASIQC